jgi:hypothetical protein
MSKPKAEWKVDACGEEWSAEVGPFGMVVAPHNGSIELWQRDPLERLWLETQPTPCDAADLMRLAEAELARRIEHTAETMDWTQLVAGKLETKEQPAYAPCLECGQPQPVINGKSQAVCYRCLAKLGVPSSPRSDLRLPPPKFNLYQEHAADLARKCVEYACKICGIQADPVFPTLGSDALVFRPDANTIGFKPGCKCALQQAVENEWAAFAKVYEKEHAAALASGPTPRVGCSRNAEPESGASDSGQTPSPQSDDNWVKFSELAQMVYGNTSCSGKSAAVQNFVEESRRLGASHVVYSADPATGYSMATAMVELKDGQMKVVDVLHSRVYGQPFVQGSRDWAIAMMREGKRTVDSEGVCWFYSSAFKSWHSSTWPRHNYRLEQHRSEPEQPEYGWHMPDEGTFEWAVQAMYDDGATIVDPDGVSWSYDRKEGQHVRCENGEREHVFSFPTLHAKGWRLA